MTWKVRVLCAHTCFNWMSGIASPITVLLATDPWSAVDSTAGGQIAIGLYISVLSISTQTTSLHRHPGIAKPRAPRWKSHGTQKCVLKSEFGHVWFLTTLAYLLKPLYATSCVVGGRMAWNLFILSIVCVYTFFCSFLYGALCPRSC